MTDNSELIEVDIICPLYNGYDYLEKLYKSITGQKNILINRLLFLVTNTNDNSENILKKYNLEYFTLNPEEFSHSMTRQHAIENYCESKVVIMITQDIEIFDEFSFYNLAKDVFYDKSHFAFGRQLTKYNNIEKYIREKNYPEKSYFVTKKDVNRLQLKSFFSSDVFAAYNRNVFLEIGGYDNKYLSFSEDMYYARKIIMSDHILQYNANAKVYHSHKFTLKQLYKRYMLMGNFFRDNPEFQDYKANSEGISLAIYILKRAFMEINLKVLFSLIPNMFCRYLGKKMGEHSKK